jgi:hypothetical protein
MVETLPEEEDLLSKSVASEVTVSLNSGYVTVEMEHAVLPVISDSKLVYTSDRPFSLKLSNFRAD